MTIQRPPTLRCIRCGAPPKSVKRGTNQRNFSDYKWRYMRCVECLIQFWWGTPLHAGKPHLVMRATPKSDGDYHSYKTQNINLALPIPATLDQLIAKATEVRIQERIRLFMEWTNKTPQTLTQEDRQELKRIIEEEHSKGKGTPP